MSLHYIHKNGDIQLGVWKITETEEQLMCLLGAPWICDELKCYTSPSRRLECLAVRVLLKEMTGELCRVKHMVSGKPFLENKKISISISHTKGYVAVVLDYAGGTPGVDIEYYSDRVRKVAARFMRKDEWSGASGPDDTRWLLLHWSAKETLYKRMGMQEVDFCEHLKIFPFILDRVGHLEACEFRTSENRHFRIDYCFEDDFVLTWSI